MKNKSLIILKELNIKHVSKHYVDWLNDKTTMMFTEQRFKKHTFADVKSFVLKNLNSKESFLYGVFVRNNKKLLHIGNIKLGPIDNYHKFSYISYFIGNKKFLGKGYGKIMIKEILKIAKKKFKLRKILAGTYALNVSSIKVLKVNGFKLEGKIKKLYKFNKKYVDHLVYGKLI